VSSLSSSDTLIQAEALSRRIGERLAVDHVSFAVVRGERCALDRARRTRKE